MLQVFPRVFQSIKFNSPTDFQNGGGRFLNIIQKFTKKKFANCYWTQYKELNLVWSLSGPWILRVGMPAKSSSGFIKGFPTEFFFFFLIKKIHLVLCGVTFNSPMVRADKPTKLISRFFLRNFLYIFYLKKNKKIIEKIH